MLTISQLSKRLGKREVIKQLELEIGAGQVFGLLGPNGAGKTTLIRMIMGLLHPDSGRLELFDGEEPGSDAARRLIGYMPQQVSLYPGLTVWENILFFGRLYGMEETRLLSRAREVMEMVELEGRRDDAVATLSGGMARRTMLASALVHEPRLLILDEPTAGVDPLLRIRFWQWFRQMEEEGTSIIVTTHNISEAKQCDSVVFLRDGEKLEQGSPGEIMARYECDDLEDAFVAATLSRHGGNAAEVMKP